MVGLVLDVTEVNVWPVAGRHDTTAQGVFLQRVARGLGYACPKRPKFLELAMQTGWNVKVVYFPMITIA